MVLKKKGKLLKFVGAFAFAASLVSSPITSLAAEGGWTEGEGYWVGSSSTDNISLMSTDEPDRHWATYDHKDMDSYLAERVVAHTNWEGEYHYSRARYEGPFGYEGDSDRVWGTDQTVAYSGYVDPAFAVAHTYWGN